MRFDRHGDDAAAARFGGRAVSEANFKNLPVLLKHTSVGERFSRHYYVKKREKVLRELSNLVKSGYFGVPLALARALALPTSFEKEV